MTVLYVVLPITLILVCAAVVAFLWAARRGQFDDLDTPPLRALEDEEGTCLVCRPDMPWQANERGRTMQRPCTKK